MSYKHYLFMAIPFVTAFILVTLYAPDSFKRLAFILILIPIVTRGVVNFVLKRKERNKQ
ncbi:hypothetical protein P343_07735 [Sporolactobacillus laevolacticus DSM 442]|uniref:Uncharacterized protein n=1 Tax=Sporolactobacillus laevolacticus DSM 442 TaxID=1395513 RepID=V6IXV8_9BACL|nr:hypothetical protein P343_07735 [Sporolactobacillus laevolacticus DSM 442]